jgi:hypothetical protein
MGEVMMVAHGGGAAEAKPGGRETMGYASFVARRQDPLFARWFAKLETDVRRLGDEPGRHHERLIRLQNALIDLVDFLDPDYRRFPPNRRTKLAPEVRPSEPREAGPAPAGVPATREPS